MTIEVALAWAQQAQTGRETSVWPRRMTAVRGFARYLAGIDASTEVPPLGLMPHRQRWRRPVHLLPGRRRHGDRPGPPVDRLAVAGGHLRHPDRAARASGMRIGEAIELDRGDVDWAQGVLLIRESKFGKSRLVPLGPAAWRRCRVTPGCVTSSRRARVPSFFVSLSRKRLLYAVVSQTYRQLVDDSGVRAGAPRPPRLHDLRHTFAVRTHNLRHHRTLFSGSPSTPTSTSPWASTHTPTLTRGAR